MYVHAQKMLQKIEAENYMHKKLRLPHCPSDSGSGKLVANLSSLMEENTKNDDGLI